MICEDEVFKIGKFIKPHGIKGEINLLFDSDIFDKTDCQYLICKIEGIFVPFFIEGYRFKGSDTALILLEDVKSEQQAKRFNGLEVYFPRKFIDQANNIDLSLDYFIGFSIYDQNNKYIGIISEIDESTINTLFLVTTESSEEIIIPASDDFITNINDDQKNLYMDLPEGLLT